MWSRSYTAAAVLSVALLLGNVFAGRFGQMPHKRQKQAESLLHKRQEPYGNYTGNLTAGFRYLSNNTAPYLVDALPDVPYDVGELYSGLIDINAGNSSRSLFFMFYPTIGEPVDEITIWLNGGPGCSSLDGFLRKESSPGNAMISLHIN